MNFESGVGVFNLARQGEVPRRGIGNVGDGRWPPTPTGAQRMAMQRLPAGSSCHCERAERSRSVWLQLELYAKPSRARQADRLLWPASSGGALGRGRAATVAPRGWASRRLSARALCCQGLLVRQQHSVGVRTVSSVRAIVPGAGYAESAGSCCGVRARIAVVRTVSHQLSRSRFALQRRDLPANTTPG